MKKVIIKYGIISGAALVLAITIFLIIFFNRSVVVPEVTGKSITEATKFLDEAGFKFITSEKYSDVELKDIVISQDIAGGSKAKYGSEIALVVSKGKEQVALPNLKGDDKAVAEERLKKLGFTVTTKERFSSTVDAGKVMHQSVFAGETADKGAQITLTISKGPDLVAVPNIKGMTLEKAQQALNAAGLRLETEIQCSSVKEGRIISQDITANKKILRNSVIYAKISAGVANKRGTTPSNANNFGTITTQGNWIYFASSDYDIYRMRKDKSEIQRIHEGAAVSINVVGEWVYFVAGTSEGGIYKVKIDGTDETKLSNATSYQMYVEGDWIYYTSDVWGGKLYKMKTDGSSVTQILSENCNEFIVNNGYIYYANSADKLIYKCNTDGKGKTVLCAGFGGGELAFTGEKIVAVNDGKVQSVNLDGSGFTSFGTSNVQYALLNGYDGWVYYLEHDFRGNTIKSTFCRIKPDGSQRTKIYDYEYLNHANAFLNVADGWIYFQNEHENDALYRVKIDGTGFERVG